MQCRASILGLFLGLAPFAALSQTLDDTGLCEGTAIVTGTRADTRAEALARALRDVLVKRSGNAALLRDAQVAKLSAKAADPVEDYFYLDRLSDQPKHDEQGTRDRPYTLIAHFSPAKIDAALTELGERPWLAKRPKLLVRIGITDARHGSFRLTADGDNDERYRQALLAASVRYGMHLVLEPSDHPELGNAASDAMVVSGTLRWSDGDAGWVGAWQTDDSTAAAQSWGIKGVSFDEAFRDLVWGAMAIASGHTPP
jgi:hypothetical protein